MGNTKKQIVVISGSARRGGNTELLVNSFAGGAREAGHSVDVFEAAHKNIKGCRACNNCYTKGDQWACVFGDDFNELAPLVEKADMIVFASPLYWFSFSAQIKAAIDKIYALYLAERPVKVTEAMLMVCAETELMEDFKGIVASYELIVSYIGWQDRGQLLVPEVNLIGDIEKTDALDRAAEIGRSL